LYQRVPSMQVPICPFWHFCWRIVSFSHEMHRKHRVEDNANTSHANNATRLFVRRTVCPVGSTIGYHSNSWASCRRGGINGRLFNSCSSTGAEYIFPEIMYASIFGIFLSLCADIRPYPLWLSAANCSTVLAMQKPCKSHFKFHHGTRIPSSCDLISSSIIHNIWFSGCTI